MMLGKVQLQKHESSDQNTPNSSIIFRVLLILLFSEIVIGGGGRFFEFGSLTLRMILFLIALLSTLTVLTFKKRISVTISTITGLFFLVSVVSISIGWLNGASFALIFEDIKPLSFFLILPFFSCTVKTYSEIEILRKIIIMGAIFLAISYLLTITLIVTGYLDFASFYDSQYEIGEIFFRGGPFFFYKGFLYLCIGFFFILLSKIRYKIFFLILLFSCICLTLTRGFIIFTSLISMCYVFFINKNKFTKFAWIILISIGSLWMATTLLDSIGDRSESDTTRFIQFDQVFSSISPLSFFVGHGFGVGINERPVHMENSFLEIFHKQGLMGLLFWFSVLFYIFWNYANIKIKQNKEIVLPFLLSVVFVFFQSLTNPFLNNPIGLAIIVATIAASNQLLNIQKSTK
jgi:hypothetical protein